MERQRCPGCRQHVDLLCQPRGSPSSVHRPHLLKPSLLGFCPMQQAQS